MKKLTVFHLDHCPYCVNARRALEALRAENPAYARVEVAWIEESRYPELARARDYYYVPAVFVGEGKLYEARPGDSYETILDRMRSALDAAL